MKKLKLFFFKLFFGDLYKELREKRDKVKILNEENNRLEISLKTRNKACKELAARYKNLKSDFESYKKKNK